MGKSRRQRRKAARGATEKGWNLPVSGGYLPSDAGQTWNWWQRGFNIQHASKSAIVESCISAYAHTIASLPGHEVELLENGGKRRLNGTTLSRLLRRPNSYQTRSDFMLNLTWGLMGTGNSYAVGIRNDRGEFGSAHLLGPDTAPWVEPETREIFYAVGYNPLFPGSDQIDGQQMLIPARDVLHVRLYAPQHPLIGVSPIRNLAASIASTGAIENHQAVFFDNMRRPSGILSVDTKLTKEQVTEMRKLWDAQSQHLDSGGVPILAGGQWKWSPMSITSQDAQVVEAFNMGLEQIARAFRVPLPLIGDQRHSTYNNVEQLVSAWLAMGLGFVLEHIELALTKWLDLPPTHICEFNVDQLLRTDFAGRVEGLTRGIQGGLYSVNEARRREGLPSVEFGDEPRLQAQNVPLSQIDMMQSAPAAPAAPAALPPPPEPSDEEQRILAYHSIKSVLHEA